MYKLTGEKIWDARSRFFGGRERWVNV